MRLVCLVSEAGTSALPFRHSRLPRTTVAQKLRVAQSGPYAVWSNSSMTKSRPNPLRLLAHMLAAVFNSRAAFHREWQRWDNPPVSDPVAGRWTGEWVSEKSGHRGELRCVLTPDGSNFYRAHFYATFSKLFSVGYVTKFEAARTDGCVHLRGEEDLGRLAGGVYRCEGNVQQHKLLCQYSCRYDRGIFRLERRP